MLTNFFASSKPIQTIVALIYMMLAYGIYNRSTIAEGATIQEWGLILVGLLLYLLGLLLYGFIVRKNELTGRSSYALILFACFTATIPGILQSPKMLCAGFVVLLAFRRIISLKSGVVIERKLYDASVLLTIVCLFYFWSFGFFLLLFLSIFLYAREQLRFWFIPFLGVITVLLFLWCYALYTSDNYTYVLTIVDDISFDFRAYSKRDLYIGTSILLSIGLWCLGPYVRQKQNAVFSQRGLYVIILTALGTAVLPILFVSEKRVQLGIFLFYHWPLLLAII